MDSLPIKYMDPQGTWADVAASIAPHMTIVRDTIEKRPGIMTLVVGPNKVHLTCNKALLAYFSDFFAALCFGHFCEAQTNTAELPEDDPTQIKTFLTWSATGSLESFLPGPTLERMWVTGKRLLAPEYCNSIMATIMNRKDGYLTEHTANDAEYIFEHASRGSPLNRYTTSLVMCGRSHNPWAGPDEDPKSENIIQFGE